jgi:hypothetical protein
MACSLPGLLSTVLLVSGCATSTAIRFDGTVSQGAARSNTQTRIDGCFQIDRGRGLLMGYRFDGLGILVLACDRRARDGDSEPSPGSTVDNAYLFAVDRIDWTLMQEFAAAGPSERKRFPGAYPVRGTISVDRWGGLTGRAIRLGVEAADPQRTRFNGSLCPYLEFSWDGHGLGPM